MATNLNIKLAPSDQFLSDVLTTAVETPYGDWFYFARIKQDSQGNVIGGAVVTDGKNEEVKRDFSLATAKKGIKLILEGKVKLGAEYLGMLMAGLRDDDAGQVDSVLADAIMQAGVFGELVYG